MYAGQLVFSQLMDYLPMYEFRKCVHRYEDNRRIRNFSCMDQFLCMAFAPLAGCESIRDIETCIRAMTLRFITLEFVVTFYKARSLMATIRETSGSMRTSHRS